MGQVSYPVHFYFPKHKLFSSSGGQYKWTGVEVISNSFIYLSSFLTGAFCISPKAQTFSFKLGKGNWDKCPTQSFSIPQNPNFLVQVEGNISGQVVKPILALLFFRVNGLYKDTYLLLLVFGRIILKWNMGIDLRGAVLVDSRGGGRAL